MTRHPSVIFFYNFFSPFIFWDLKVTLFLCKLKTLFFFFFYKVHTQSSHTHTHTHTHTQTYTHAHTHTHTPLCRSFDNRHYGTLANTIPLPHPTIYLPPWADLLTPPTPPPLHAFCLSHPPHLPSLHSGTALPSFRRTPSPTGKLSALCHRPDNHKF